MHSKAENNKDNERAKKHEQSALFKVFLIPLVKYFVD